MSNPYSQYLRSLSPLNPWSPAPSAPAHQESNSDEALKSSRFFKKSDIVPFTRSDFGTPSIEQSRSKAAQAEDLLQKLDHEMKLRLIAESDNSRLKSKITQMQELEKTSREQSLRGSSLHNSSLLTEIENLRLRFRSLTEENDLLRSRLKEKPEITPKASQQSLKQAELTNRELLRELSESKDAYEALRKLYANDVASQKARYESLNAEKHEIELKLKASALSRPSPEAADSVQDKIRRMKSEYREKVKQLELRVRPEGQEQVSDSRLKEIEARLAELQSKLVGQSDCNEEALMKQTMQKSSRASPRRQNSPNATWRTMNAAPDVLDSGHNSPCSNRSPRGTQRAFKEGVKPSRGRIKKDDASKSPCRGPSKSPANRPSSGLRHAPQGKQSGICARKREKKGIKE